MSKLGNKTKNLLGKLKPHSQSVDLAIGANQSAHQQQGPILTNPTSRITQDTLGAHYGVMGSDPGSTDGHTFGVDKQEPLQTSKGKAQWSEHVWTAWVHRGFSDDVTEVNTVQPGADLITKFQKDKFRHFFFHVLDLNSDCVISAEDFEKLNERIRHYMDWSVNSIQYLALKEVHGTFLECFLTLAGNFSKKSDGAKNPEKLFENWKLGFPIGALPPSEHKFDFWDPFKRLDALYDKMLQDRGDVFVVIDGGKDVPVRAKTCVSIDEWVDVWGILVGKAKKMDDFPMWLQYYPKVLFDVINRSGSGAITKSELKYFYTAFMDVGKLGEQRLDEITDNAYKAMTSDGDVRLTYHIYKLSFMNFLLGKQPNGPGQYIFGTVQPAQPNCMFPIDYSAMNATEEDKEPFRHEKLEEKSSRRSVIV